jgi:hypothetical protein
MHFVPDIMVSKVSILILFLYYFHWSINMENSHIEQMFEYINSKPNGVVWHVTAIFLQDTEKFISALKAYFIWPLPLPSFHVTGNEAWSDFTHSLLSCMKYVSIDIFLNREVASSPEKWRPQHSSSTVTYSMADPSIIYTIISIAQKKCERHESDTPQVVQKRWPHN